MPFEWRVFELAKEPEHPDQNQDAWWLNAHEGVAAIADGVTSGIFSRQWAQILTRAAVADWPDPSDDERFPRWLADLRTRWESEIDTSGLAWYQRAKLREGGFSTLVWLRLLDNQGLRDGRDQSPIEVMAVGDSCVFHVRNDALLESFPLEASSQFDSSPMVLGSVDLKRDGQLQFERLEISCRTGDMLVLCTDAVAAWALDRYEQGEPVLWSQYWDMPPEAWVGEICSLRNQGRMRYDDATLLLLRVGQSSGDPAEEHVPPVIRLPENSLADEPPEVDLLAVDDWGEPGVATDVPTQVVAADEPTCVVPDAYDLRTPEPKPEPESEDASDTYDLRAPDPEPQAGPGLPPPLPPRLRTGDPPPAPTHRPAEDDWRDQVNAISERLVKRLSEGLSRGADKLQEAKELAIKKLREKKEGKPKDDGSERPGP